MWCTIFGHTLPTAVCSSRLSSIATWPYLTSRCWPCLSLHAHLLCTSPLLPFGPTSRRTTNPTGLSSYGWSRCSTSSASLHCTHFVIPRMPPLALKAILVTLPLTNSSSHLTYSMTASAPSASSKAHRTISSCPLLHAEDLKQAMTKQD